jgi:putative toxin-antitoxin system antitoxin component (TIGR02293 family)
MNTSSAIVKHISKFDPKAHELQSNQVWGRILDSKVLGKSFARNPLGYRIGNGERPVNAEREKAKARAKTAFFNSQMASKLIQQGIPSGAVGPLAEFLGVSKSELSETLGMDRSTAARRSERNLPLPSHSAEGVLRIMELVGLAEDVFDSGGSAMGWLKRRHPMLEDETPLEAAKTSYGARRVSDILVAIKYGGVV